MKRQEITLTLSEAEGLVLFEWVARLNSGDGRVFADPAEQRVSWDVEAMLEPQIGSLLSEGYQERLQQARAAVRDPEA